MQGDVQAPEFTQVQGETRPPDGDEERIQHQLFEWGFWHECFKLHTKDCLQALVNRFPDTTLIGAFKILAPGAPRAYYKDVVDMQKTGTLADFGK
jgi:hypothetical protein